MYSWQSVHLCYNINLCCSASQAWDTQGLRFVVFSSFALVRYRRLHPHPSSFAYDCQSQCHNPDRYGQTMIYSIHIGMKELAPSEDGMCAPVNTGRVICEIACIHVCQVFKLGFFCFCFVFVLFLLVVFVGCFGFVLFCFEGGGGVFCFSFIKFIFTMSRWFSLVQLDYV